MDLKEPPEGQAYRSALESLSRDISKKIQKDLERVPGYDLEYTSHIACALIQIASGTKRVYPKASLKWAHFPQKQNPLGISYARRVLREIAVSPIIETAAKMYPPAEGKLDEYEQFVNAACLMTADFLLDPLRHDLIPD